jgi:Pentapeptide repeats (8 copies)
MAIRSAYDEEEVRKIAIPEDLKVLRMGAGEVWNSWRTKERLGSPDLRGTDLRGVDLYRADLHAAADLRGAGDPVANVPLIAIPERQPATDDRRAGPIPAGMGRGGKPMPSAGFEAARFTCNLASS